MLSKSHRRTFVCFLWMLCCSLQSAKTPLNVQTKVQKQEVTTKRCVCILMHQSAHPSINSAYEDAAGGNKGSFYSSGESWVLDVSISSLEDVKYLSYDMSSFTFKLIQCQRKISRKMQRKVLVKHISFFAGNYLCRVAACCTPYSQPNDATWERSCHFVVWWRVPHCICFGPGLHWPSGLSLPSFSLLGEKTPRQLQWG